MRRRAFALIALVLVAGCGRGKQANPKDIEVKDSVTRDPLKDKKPRADKDIGEGIPTYPGAKVLSSGDGAARHTLMQTGDAPDKVIAFYHDTLKRNGWVVGKEAALPGNSVVLDSVKEGVYCTVLVIPLGAWVQATVTVSRAKDVKDVDVPMDVPVYPGAKIADARAVGDLTQLFLMTSDGLDMSLDYYKASLEKLGWQNLKESRLDMNTVLNADKAERIVTVAITAEESGVSIVVIVRKK
jgi:hypothetical protein